MIFEIISVCLLKMKKNGYLIKKDIMLLESLLINLLEQMIIGIKFGKIK